MKLLLPLPDRDDEPAEPDMERCCCWGDLECLPAAYGPCASSSGPMMRPRPLWLGRLMRATELGLRARGRCRARMACGLAAALYSGPVMVVGRGEGHGPVSGRIAIRQAGWLMVVIQSNRQPTTAGSIDWVHGRPIGRRGRLSSMNGVCVGFEIDRAEAGHSRRGAVTAAVGSPSRFFYIITFERSCSQSTPKQPRVRSTVCMFVYGGPPLLRRLMLVACIDRCGSDRCAPINCAFRHERPKGDRSSCPHNEDDHTAPQHTTSQSIGT